MCRSVFFAQIIGCYLVLLSLAILIHYDRFKKVITEYLESPMMIFSAGSFSLIFGLFILVPHNVWVLQWPILITLVGWFCIIKAIFRLFFPLKVVRITKSLLAKKGFIFCSWIWLLIGLYLAWMGFSGC